MTLTTVAQDDPRSIALLKAIGFDRLAPEQRELALSIAARYELDVMLKHLVMIEGRPYITRDGLLHVAHKSGAFDGMETTEPALTEDQKFWRSTCSVWRKDMTRPFTYTGRYPVAGRNAQYAPEMAIKVGEVMALRRAFDVAAPVLEERWDQPVDLEPEPAAPASLQERVAAKAAAIEPEPTEAQEPEPEPAPAEASPQPVSETMLNVIVAEMAADSLAQFAAWAKAEGIPTNAIRSRAKAMFPEAKNIRDLDAAQIAELRAALAEPEAPPVEATDDVITAELVDPEAAICGAKSPLSDAVCTLEAGHLGVHRASARESWIPDLAG